MFQIERIFLNGCSFSGDRIKAAGVKTWPGKIVSEYFKVPLHTMISAGRGNRRIATSTLIWFAQNYKLHKGTYAIIQWSTPLRRDYTIKKPEPREGQILKWKSWKIHEEKNFMLSKPKWDLDTELTLYTLEQILLLQMMFQKNNIPYVMYQGLNCFLETKHPDVKSLLNQIDWSRWFRPKINQHDYCVERNWICTPNDPHPNTEGQTEWGDSLVEWIRNDIDTNYL